MRELKGSGLTQAVGKVVVSLRAEVAVVAGIVQFAGTVTVRRFAVVTIGTRQVALTGPALGISEVSIVTGVTVWRRELLPTLAPAGGVRAVSRRVEIIAVAS